MLPAVCRYVFNMGISPRHKGFACICEMISALLESGWPCVKTGAGIDAAYRSVFGSDSEARRTAERCMRYAVQYAWDTGSAPMHGLFDRRPVFGSETGAPCCAAPPALADFIYAAALELWESGVIAPSADGYGAG